MTIKSRLSTWLFGIAYRLCSDQVCSLIEDIGYIHEDYVYEYACDNYDPYC